MKAAALDTGSAEQTAHDGPVTVLMTFLFQRPRSHYRTGRNAHLLRDSAPPYPDRPPDTSKLVRSTEDALTDAGVWTDDARVVSVRARKVWAGKDGLPGALIAVWPADPPSTEEGLTA